MAIKPASRALVRNLLLALAVSSLFALGQAAFADESSFSQKIEWKSNANAFEYKVEIQNVATGKSTFVTTDKTETELSLLPGKYRYRVQAYDFLGREAGLSAWTGFEVLKASKPKVKLIDQNIQLDKKNNTLSIDVDISDINANSMFELVADSLDGTLDRSEQRKLGTNGAETGSASKIYFTDVPPGKWRLKVTNASGLSTLSDVITVTGEKTYTEDEMQKIREDAEAAVRKDMQEHLDEYIKQAEEQKKAREKEFAEETARLEAEKQEAEKARIAAEKAAKEEEQRLLLEKKEAERKAKAEWRAAHPYKWKDVIFEAGLAFSYSPYDGTLSDYYGTSSAPALNARFAVLPVKTAANKIGFEVSALRFAFSCDDDLFDSTMTMMIFDAKLVWQHALSKKLFLAMKAGAGAGMFEKHISYVQDYDNRTNPADKTFVYPALSAGISLFCTPWKFLVFEFGADLTHVAAGGMPTGFLVPYACVGFRF